MAILGIHLSTEPHSIAICKPKTYATSQGNHTGFWITEKTLSADFDTSENLILHINQFLKESKLTLKKIKAIGITTGPGAYTSTRIGVTTAKSIAQTLNRPLFGISSLEALPFSHRTCTQLIFSCIPSRGQEYNCSLFSFQRQKLTRLTPDFTCTTTQLIKKLTEIKEPVTVLGYLTTRLKNRLSALTPHTIFPSQIRATDIAMQVHDCLKEGTTSSYKDVNPVYAYKAYNVPRI